MAIPEDWMLVLKGWSDRLTALYALLSSIIKRGEGGEARGGGQR